MLRLASTEEKYIKDGRVSTYFIVFEVTAFVLHIGPILFGLSCMNVYVWLQRHLVSLPFLVITSLPVYYSYKSCTNKYFFAGDSLYQWWLLKKPVC